MDLSICAIFKNEAPYLAEWIEFHRLVGVERFYLYENNSDDDWERVLRPYVLAGIVDVRPWPMASPSQFGAYQHFIDRHRGSTQCAAFIDCDEFLFSPKGQTVTAVLERPPFREYGAIAVNWLCFGSGGQELQTDGLVIERFAVRRAADFEWNKNIKSVVRMDCVEEVGGDPHLFKVHGGTWSESGEQVKASLVWPPRHEWLRVNHYVTKSREEWVRKIARGRADVPCRRDLAEFEAYQPHEVVDEMVWRFLPELKRRLAGTDR
jgi:hypothetical protein